MLRSGGTVLEKKKESSDIDCFQGHVRDEDKSQETGCCHLDLRSEIDY